jgi:hypothetical protein
VFGDLLESGVDKTLGHYLPTGIAQQTGEFIYDVVKARGDSMSNFAMHSQGNLLSNAGIRYMGYDAFTDLDIKKGMVTFGSFGSPESYATFNTTIKGMEATYNGTSTHDGDAVGERLGGNVGVNGERGFGSYFDIINPSTYIDVVKLFTADSVHSTYYCGETQIGDKKQFNCGG